MVKMKLTTRFGNFEITVHKLVCDNCSNVFGIGSDSLSVNICLECYNKEMGKAN